MNKKLLVVDDDPNVRKTLVLLLGTSWEILEASTGREALRIIDTEHPRLMLLDMSMAPMGGLEVLKAIKAAGVEMTIMVLTSHDDVELAQQALALGAVEYITKPFNWKHLKERVARSMEPVPRDARKRHGVPWRTAITPMREGSNDRNPGAGGVLYPHKGAAEVLPREQSMKTFLVLVCMLMVGLRPLCAQEKGAFGAGVVVGNPTGGTAKLWLDDSQALDVGLGFSSDFAVYADYLWHSWSVLPPPPEGKLPVYLGLGLQLRALSSTELGLRTVAGIAYWLPRNPVEIFLEVAPVFRLSPHNSVGLDVGLGLRYYFKG